MPDIRPLLNEDSTELNMPASRRIVQGRLLRKVILMIYSLFGRVFPDYLNAVVIDCVEHRGLPVAINVIETESLAQQDLRASLLPYYYPRGTLPADVEQYGLLIVILEANVGPVPDQQFEQLG